MSRFHRRAFASAALCAAAAACGSFSSTSDDEPTPIVREDGGDAAEAAASADGSAPDAADASTPVEPFCETADAQFCWSFDELSQPLLGPILAVQTTEFAPVVVDSGKSLPNAMGAGISKAGNCGVRLNVAKDVSYLGCEADFSFDAVDSASTVDVSFLQLDWVGSAFNLPYLKAKKVNDSTLRAGLYFLGAPEVDLGNIPVATWVHASIETEIVGGQWVVRGAVFGNPVGALDAGPRAALPRFDRVFFGVASLGSSVVWGARVDNLVCHWQQ